MRYWLKCLTLLGLCVGGMVTGRVASDGRHRARQERRPAAARTHERRHDAPAGFATER
jgi:hypothetical protein